MQQILKSHFQKAGIDIGQGQYHEEVIYGNALVYTAMYNVIGTYLKKYHLTPEEMNALMIIKHQGKAKGLAQVDIGRRLMVNAHNMTRLLQRLEKQGLIERKGHKKDGRVTLVRIANKGSKLLDQVWPGYDARVRSSVQGLSPKEQKTLSYLLQKWLGTLVNKTKLNLG